MGFQARVLVLPGWLNSDAAHWQSRWEALHGFQRVEQADWLWPRRGDWMARLDEVLLESPSPALLVAHSLGCQLVAAWAAHSQHTARVQAALLVAPPDSERDDMPPQLHGWRPIVRAPLPFAAQVLYSDDDPYCTPERARAMAADWDVPALSVGARGHINGESGLGDWPEGLAWLQQLA
jgi:predicted alpha/beta hydrolase family esterase